MTFRRGINSRGRRTLGRYGWAGLALAILILTPLLGPGEAQAGSLAIGTHANLADLFASGVAPTAEATLVSPYALGITDPEVFSGTLESSIYWDLDANKTFAVYTITQDPDPFPDDGNLFHSADKFNIDDQVHPYTGLDAAGIVSAGYITGNPATAPVVISVSTFALPGFNSIAFEWNASDPIHPGQSATVYLAYDGLHKWSGARALLANGVGAQPTSTLAVTEGLFQIHEEVPEPTTLLLMGLGLVGVARRVRQKKRSQA